MSRTRKRPLYLNATRPGDTNTPGVGPDGVYRDPWGNPYIITVDLNYDDKARDAFYRNPPSRPTRRTAYRQARAQRSDPDEGRQRHHSVRSRLAGHGLVGRAGQDD